MTGKSNKIAGTITKALFKTLVTLAVTVALSLLLWRLDPRIGMLVLVVGPVLSMIQSYKHEWPLHWATILLPAFAAVASFVVQLATFPVGQAVSFLAPAILFGLLLGSLQGRGHRIHLRGTRVMVKRTWPTLVVWTVCFLATQTAALFNLREIVGLSMAGGAFSTAMVLGLSLVLFSRYRKGRRQIVRLKKAAQLAVLLFAFILPFGLAAPLRLQAQDTQSVADQLLLDSDLPQRFTLIKQFGQRVRADTTQELQQLSGQLRQANLTPPRDIGRLTTLFDNNPMANMAILSLVLYEFPGSEDAAAFYNLIQKELSATFGRTWEMVSGCGDMAVQMMDEWTGYALSARGRWVIQMIMQYPSTLFITAYDSTYSPDVKRAALEQARAQVMGPLAGMLRTADSRLPGTAVSRRDRSDDDSGNRTGSSESRSLPSEGTAAAAAGVILLLSGGAVSIASGAASAAASALQAALSNAAQSAGEAGSRILSGDEALRWLMNNKFIKDGQPTDKFTNWQRQLASNETPDKDGLGAMVGNWSWGEKWGPEGQRIDLGHKDTKGNWVEPEITIVVGGGEPQPPSEPKAPPPDEGPGPEPEFPPEKKEPPPEKESPPPPPEEESVPPSPDETCKDDLRTIHLLEAGIEKIKQINQQMQNEIHELQRQLISMTESWAACAVVDGASWVVSEFLVLNPAVGIPAGALQAAVVNALKNTIREYFLGDKTRPADYDDAMVKGTFFKGMAESFKFYVHKQLEQFTQIPPSGPPPLTRVQADKFVTQAGQLVRSVANPFFMGVDFGTLKKQEGAINELIDHKKNLILSNTGVIGRMDLDLRAANEKYLDCAGRAMEAIKRFVERKKETEEWVAQQKQARRQRLRGTFGG